MPISTVFIPGPYDQLAPLLRAALLAELGPDAGMAPLHSWTPADDARQKAGPAGALVLGPGAEESAEPATTDGEVRFVQFTGCYQSAAAVLALQERGITVAGAGSALAPFVADHTLALIRAALGRTGHDALDGLTAGLIGLGNVGLEVARRLGDSGARIVYHDLRTAAQGAAMEAGARRQSLDRVLVESDIVSLHVSDTPNTAGMIGDRELRLMKKGAVLINTSRPEALDEDAVAAALDSARIRAVALGVALPRPGERPGPLERRDDVVIDTEEATALNAAAQAVSSLVARNIKRLDAGEEPAGILEPVGLPGVGDPAFWSSQLAPREPH